MRVKLVVPLDAVLLSAGETVMLTPLAGEVEFTVKVYVVTDGVLLELPPPPHASIDRINPIVKRIVAGLPECLIFKPPPAEQCPRRRIRADAFSGVFLKSG